MANNHPDDKTPEADQITDQNRKRVLTATSLGIIFAIAAALVFSLQDGISKYMATQYNVFFVVMLRYWAFAAFVLVMSSRGEGGIAAVARSQVIGLQFFRGMLLVLQICVIIWSFANIGLISTHVIFAAFPLLVTALSVPFLKETVGWQRWLAIFAGFAGVVIILQPGSSVFSPISLIPCLTALMFAFYHILTRYVSRFDTPQTSFFWTGIGGAVTVSFIGPFFWDPMVGFDWFWMLALAILGALGHYLTIRALAIAEASSIQPFFFLQLVFTSLVALVVFSEGITLTMLFGAMIIVGSGMFTFWRERQRNR